MKILYFGTVCDLDEYEKRLQTCKQKPTVATINFEMALLDGFRKNKVDVDVYSFPMIPTFPKSRMLYWGSKRESLDCGFECVWLKTLNIPFVKQLSRRLDGRRIIKKWLQNNINQECAILTYSIPPFLVKNILKYSKKYKVKCYAIVPDLIKNMYINAKSNLVVRYIKNQYLKEALKYQGMFDGYIYLTEAMKEEVNSDKPHIVMEGIANINTFNKITDIKKSINPVIMYAGRLHEKYGIIKLIDAFEMINVPNAELWIFGNGSAVSDIEQRVNSNAKIRYMGRRPLQEILYYERKATLLVNPRSTKETYTKFSFPSKTLEYMLSGTPLLTTRLVGIPKEYYQYVFNVEDNDVRSMALKIEDILKKDRVELEEFGRRAQEFVSKEKNSEVQVGRILSFMKNMEGCKTDES